MAVDTSTAYLQCSNPECKVVETGKCIEGLELSKCPHFGRAVVAPTPGEKHSAEQGETKPAVTLPSGRKLNLLEASAVMMSAESRIVAIVGHIDVGKTTLISSMYDLFQMGPLGNLRFRRSQTLAALEEACHHSRAASKRTEPFAMRTPIGTFGLYHLGIADTALEYSLDLLLGDRSGEEYKLVADDPAVARKYAEIARADVITILVDGLRLLDVSARHNARSSAQMIVQGLVDSGVLSPGRRLAVVLTKLDEIVAAENGDRARKDFDQLVQHMVKLYGGFFSDVAPFLVAASPRTDALTFGYGLPELLQYWIDARQIHAPIGPVEMVPLRAIDRVSELAR
jgi:hypothetical protein